MMDKTTVRVTAISSALAVIILTVGIAGFAAASTGATPKAKPVAKQQAVVTNSTEATNVIKGTTKTIDDWIEYLRLEAEEEAREAAEDKAEAEQKAKVGARDAAEEAREAEESAREAQEAQKRYEDALAAQQQGTPTAPTPSAPAPSAPAPSQNQPAPAQPAPQPSAPQDNVAAGGTVFGDDIYKQEGGVVYEWDDDGYWEPEYDKKIEGNIIYEYDDGRWEADKKIENGITYEWDDGRWEIDDD